MKKKLAALVAMALTVSLIGGCGSKFDAGKYVQSVLDLTTKGKTTDYEKLTDSTTEEADKLYRDQIDTELSAMGISDTSTLSEDMQAKYEQLVKDILATAKYEIGEVTEKDGNYTVQVKATQAMITKDLNNKFNEQVQAYQDELTASVNAGGEVPSDAEMEGKVYEIMYNLLNENVQNITYGDEQTIEVHVNNKDKVYSIPDEDYTILDSVLYNTDEFDSIE